MGLVCRAQFHWPCPAAARDFENEVSYKRVSWGARRETHAILWTMLEAGWSGTDVREIRDGGGVGHNDYPGSIQGVPQSCSSHRR